MRGQSAGEPIPMAGVPVVRLGMSEAICERVGEVAAANGTAKRKRMRIVAPGTSGTLRSPTPRCSAKADAPLLAVARRAATFGLAWLALASIDACRTSMSSHALRRWLNGPGAISARAQRARRVPRKMT